MKHQFLAMLTLVAACTAAPKESNEVRQIEVSTEPAPMQFDYEKAKMRFTLDSTNSWCAGDTGSKVFHYSKGDSLIAIDSFFSGEYGHRFVAVIMVNDNVTHGWRLKSETLFPSDNSGASFLVIESIFDFTNSPIAKARQDTLDYNTPIPATLPFTPLPLSNPDSIRQELRSEAHFGWNMDDDC